MMNGKAIIPTLTKTAFIPIASGLLQRCTATTECSDCRKKREGMLQRAAVNHSPIHEVPPIVHEVLRSPGQPLDATTRAFMEPRFEHNFSGVRVHNDAKAAESARAVNALAYTVGRDVVFGNGQYAPHTYEGRRLVAHELVHVVQQHGSQTLTTSESALEAEAGDMGNTIALGQSAFVRHTATPNRPQFERLRFRGREFEVGNVYLHGQASEDVRTHGVLLPGPDQAHLIVTSDGRLGYELSHMTPDDPFRWARLKEIVDNGRVDIYAVTFPGNFRVREVSNGRTGPVIPRRLFDLRGAGITLVRRSVHERIFPAESTFTVSPNEDRDTIYYESGRGGRGLIGGNALAHELYGHLWLAMQGVPFLHPESIEEAEQAAERRGESLTVEQRVRIMQRERTLGQLRPEHGIRDPFGNIYTGSVRDYINRYAGAGISALESPTQRVSNEWLERSLEALLRALQNPSSLRRTSETEWQFSPELHLQWGYVSNNYEVLFHIMNRSSFGQSPSRLSEGVLNLILDWYDNQFTDEQRVGFRVFLSAILSPGGRVPTRLARDISAAIRNRRSSR